MYIVHYWQKKSGGNGLLFVKTIFVFFRNSSSTFVVPFCPIGCILVFRPRALCHCPSMSGSALKDIWIIISIWWERLEKAQNLRPLPLMVRAPSYGSFSSLIFRPYSFLLQFSPIYYILTFVFVLCKFEGDISSEKRQRERGRKRG